MILIACLDERGGMLFNRRRQSQDRLLREDLIREAAGRTLWMNGYSLKQFSSPPERIQVSETFLEEAGPGELCFVEDRDIAPWTGRAEGLILYLWNRSYPADVYCTASLEDWRLERREEFAGSSHEKITKEVYTR